MIMRPCPASWLSGLALSLAACPSPAAPDGVIAAIASVQKWSTIDGITAYSFGLTTCNLGDGNLAYNVNTNQHPVFTQNLYRLHNGRLEHIGLGWGMHAFCALQASACGVCTPAGPGCPPALGAGCSSPESASIAGTQNLLGPRSQINPSTGYFPIDWDSNLPAASTALHRRVQVHVSDLDPALNGGATYFAEVVLVQPQDALANENDNNASHRAVTIGALSGGGYALVPAGVAFTEQPALYAWQLADPGVAIETVDVPDSLPNLDGRYLVAHRATPNRDGTWHYEYAILNASSDRAARSFAVPLPDGAMITNVGFHDVDYHSGDGVNNITTDGTDWAVALAAGLVSWSTDSFDSNPNANALRWGTLYNFRFDSILPPATAQATIGLFKPGTPDEVSVIVTAPGAAETCAVDLSGDGAIDGADLGELLLQWGDCPINCFTLTCSADLNEDCTVDGADLGELLLAWGECP
jgi:hypothetical protein